jgi:hypothetical protein
MANREWSSTIEETAHMLALPFLMAPSPRRQPHGTFDVTVETVAVSGERKAQRGTLTLTSERGELVVERGSRDEQTFVLFYLQVDNVYAFVRPDGIYRSSLAVVDGVLAGRVVGYGSPQLTSPSGNPPFMTFVGQLGK